MKSGQKNFALLVSAIAITYALIAIGTHVYVRSVLLPKLDANRGALDRFEPRILADLKLLTEKPVYTALPREKNAERFLTGFIGWDGGDALETIEHTRLVDFMKQHQDALKSEDEWSSFIDDDALDDLDLAWVDQLSAYDYLDFETHPRYVDELSRVTETHGMLRAGILGRLPIPNYLELRFAALARAAQMSLENRAPEALELYRHVGYLMSTSDSLAGSLTAVTMLQNEKRLADYLDIEWTPIDNSRIDAMKRTAWAWGGIERLVSVTDGSLGAYEPYFARANGACAAMLDLPGPEGLLIDYLRPSVLGEPDVNERLDHQAVAIARVYEKCGHPEMKAFLAPMQAPLQVGRFTPNPARIPFLRRLIGLGFAAEANPNYVRFYEENPRQPASK